jgi:DNA repair protein RadC
VDEPNDREPTPRHPPGCPRRPPPRPLLPTQEPVPARLEALGADALTTAELLGVVLGPGGTDGRATLAARRLLARTGGLRRLATATPAEVRSSFALSRNAALRLVGAFALGRRAHAERLVLGRTLATGEEVFDAFHARMRDLRKERFVSVLLDARGRVLREDLVSEGTLTASLVHPREVFAPAIRESACSLLLVHNHPSGDPEPSPEDHALTQRLAAVGEIVGIRVLDHVVIGDGRYVSFLERGALAPSP